MSIQMMRTNFQNQTNLYNDIPNFKIGTIVDANIAAKCLPKINRSAKQMTW